LAAKGTTEKAAARRLQAIELRKAGATYRQIGERLSVSEAQAYNDVQRELARLATQTQDAAAALRVLESERLDALMLALWQQAKQGNQGAIDRVLKVMERRARLVGLDAPTRIDHTVDVYEVIIGGDSPADKPAA
jgi:DNA-binding CsgD family transcriptional regulator